MLKLILLASVALGALTGSVFAGELVVGSVAEDAGSNWDGYYLGANGGYERGAFDATDGLFSSSGIAGWFVGGQWGYNYSISEGVVVGVEADVNWSKINGSTDVVTQYYAADPLVPHTSTFQDTLSWTGAVTGHIGLAAGPMMAYVLGGAAFAGSSIQNVGSNVPGDYTAGQLTAQMGWTLGAGVSALLVPQLSTFAEYRYTDYGKASYITGDGYSDIHIKDQSVRLGFNYHP